MYTVNVYFLGTVKVGFTSGTTELCGLKGNKFYGQHMYMKV